MSNMYIIKRKNIKQRGITLIALVITVIVLLILAAISINMLTGENSILKQAGNAKEKTIEANAKEEIGLAYTGTMLKKTQDQTIDTVSDLQKELQINDPEATCSGVEENMDIIYKGYKFTLLNGKIIGSEKNEQTTVEQIKDTNPGDITKDADGNVVLGTEESPYAICSIEDLVALADLVDAGEITSTSVYVKLVNSLNFKSEKSYKDSTRTSLTTYSLNGNTLQNHTYPTNILTSLTTGTGWIPIGIANEDGFLGTFDGNNKEIQDLYMDYVESNEEYVDYGLFSINDGVIQNLKITGNIKGTYKTAGEDTEMYIAALAGENYGTIKNCTSNVAVTGILDGGCYINVSGITGFNNSNILNCSNKGTIIMKNAKQTYIYNSTYASGIVAYTRKGIIEHCNNSGNIYANDTYDNCIGRNYSIKYRN